MVATHLKLELLLVNILAFDGQDDEGILPTSVGLAPHSGCITSPGDGGTPVPRLAWNGPHSMTCLALQADVCSLVLQQKPHKFKKVAPVLQQRSSHHEQLYGLQMDGLHALFAFGIVMMRQAAACCKCDSATDVLIARLMRLVLKLVLLSNCSSSSRGLACSEA